jgi:hypothetical protein
MVVRGVEIVSTALEIVVTAVEMVVFPVGDSVVSGMGVTSATEDSGESDGWTPSVVAVVQPTCTLTIVAVIVRVAGTTLPPVEVE